MQSSSLLATAIRGSHSLQKCGPPVLQVDLRSASIRPGQPEEWLAALQAEVLSAVASSQAHVRVFRWVEGSLCRSGLYASRCQCYSPCLHMVASQPMQNVVTSIYTCAYCKAEMLLWACG